MEIYLLLLSHLDLFCELLNSNG